MQTISNAVASVLHILCPRTEVRIFDVHVMCPQIESFFVQCCEEQAVHLCDSPRSEQKVTKLLKEVRAKIKVLARRRVAA